MRAWSSHMRRILAVSSLVRFASSLTMPSSVVYPGFESALTTEAKARPPARPAPCTFRKTPRLRRTAPCRFSRAASRPTSSRENSTSPRPCGIRHRAGACDVGFPAGPSTRLVARPSSRNSSPSRSRPTAPRSGPPRRPPSARSGSSKPPRPSESPVLGQDPLPSPDTPPHIPWCK